MDQINIVTQQEAPQFKMGCKLFWCGSEAVIDVVNIAEVYAYALCQVFRCDDPDWLGKYYFRTRSPPT